MPPAFREFGDPLGDPMVFFHGWPGSGRQAIMFDEAAKLHRFRILAPDRPGIGGSPFQPDRRLRDWPATLRELTGLQRFAVLGISGGGPYALACAHDIPDSLTAVSVVCGAPPLTDPDDWSLLHPGYRILLTVFHRSPALIRIFFKIAKRIMLPLTAREFFHPLRILLPRPDAESIAPPENFAPIFDCQRDAFASVDGIFADAEIYARPWGFDPANIRIPVQFWHGTDDANFSPALAEKLAARIPRASLRIMENEGHFSLPIHHASAILAALRRAC